MNSITREELIKLEIDSQLPLPDKLEKIVSTQEDASLRLPGVVAHYYRFFYYLAKKVEPILTIELGTHTGISAACLAEGNPKGKIYTVDHKNYLKEECIRDNIIYCHQDSLEPVEEIGSRDIDILFIDTNHDGERPLQEYLTYKNHMAKNGIIFFDDIYLSPKMEKFWESFRSKRKTIDLGVHGKAGFGVLLLTEDG